METKIKRIHKTPKTATYNIQYKKNGNFKLREWNIKLRKESYGWGMFELVNKSLSTNRGWGVTATSNVTEEAIPREVILKIENILRGLNS